MEKTVICEENFLNFYLVVFCYLRETVKLVFLQVIFAVSVAFKTSSDAITVFEVRSID